LDSSTVVVELGGVAGSDVVTTETGGFCTTGALFAKAEYMVPGLIVCWEESGISAAFELCVDEFFWVGLAGPSFDFGDGFSRVAVAACKAAENRLLEDEAPTGAAVAGPVGEIGPMAI
jgi:hypothetical protein